MHAPHGKHAKSVKEVQRSLRGSASAVAIQLERLEEVLTVRVYVLLCSQCLLHSRSAIVGASVQLCATKGRYAIQSYSVALKVIPPMVLDDEGPLANPCIIS